MSEVNSIAQQLDGFEYPFRVPSAVVQFALAHKIVIVFGASDDLMEFRGAIEEEVGVYDGGSVNMSPDGLVPEFDAIDKGDKEALRAYFASEGKGCKIEAVWGKDGYSWTYETDIPHATFEIVEDGDKYCRGIVFRLADCAA